MMEVKKNHDGFMENSRAWPWIIRWLWKSRNEFMFEGTRTMAKEIAVKSKGESDEWFLAQIVDKEMEVKQNDGKITEIPSSSSWLADV